MQRKLLPVCFFLAAALAARGASAIHVSFSTGDNINIRGDRVIISPEGEATAEISPAGELRIDGDRIAVSEEDRVLLARYNRAVHGIQQHAIAVGIQGAGIGVSALAAVVVALATGDTDHVERHVEARAETLKDEASALCREVNRLQRLENHLAADVPAFRPYALMADEDRPSCRVDD